MNPTPAANDPIVRIMRDSCARFTHTAENAGVLAPLLLLLAEALASFFGKLENIFLLWRAGALPPPAPKPLRAPRAPARRARASGKRQSSHRRRTPAIRPRRTRVVYPAPRASTAHPSALTPRIDRYPKPAAGSRRVAGSRCRVLFVTKSN